jgi:hypothetical protein
MNAVVGKSSHVPKRQRAGALQDAGAKAMRHNNRLECAARLLPLRNLKRAQAIPESEGYPVMVGWSHSVRTVFTANFLARADDDSCAN